MSLGWLSPVSGASPPRLPPWLLGVPKRHGCEYHAFFSFVCYFTTITMKSEKHDGKAELRKMTLELDLCFRCRDNSWKALEVASDTSTDVLYPKPVWCRVCCLLCYWRDFVGLCFVGPHKNVQDCNANTTSHDIQDQLWETGAGCSVWRMQLVQGVLGGLIINIRPYFCIQVI